MTPRLPTPTKNGAVPEPGFGYAHTWIASIPVPVPAPRSTAHPPMNTGDDDVAPGAGASIVSSGCELTTTVIVRVTVASKALVTELCAETAMRYVPAASDVCN